MAIDLPMALTPEIRASLLASLSPVTLFSDSVKTVKGEKQGVKTFVMYLCASDYLSQYTGYKFRNLCGYATDACRKACIGEHTGRMVFEGPKTARIRRTLLYHLDRERFIAQLRREIIRGVASATNAGMIPVFRPNGASDNRWEIEHPELFEEFNTLQWYDYTKIPLRFRRNLPANYWLTFSRSGNNDPDCADALETGHNVAVVFHGPMPDSFRILGKEYPVIDGDTHDIRLPQYDGVGVVVGLKAKGPARRDFDSGFVIHTA